MLMKVYNTLVIGSGYASVGYAASHADTLICEEHQICDTGFYLPLRSFQYHPYVPKTEEGKRLLGIFEQLSLFGEKWQNTNGFECGLCTYIAEIHPSLLLKCRVIAKEKRADGLYDVTLQTNEGLSHVFAKHILDTTPSIPSDRVTVLFVTKNSTADTEKLLSLFPGATIEPTGCDGRYALHLPTQGEDENAIKVTIYRKWNILDTDAKILYIAPVFYSDAKENGLCDCNYKNPVEALEAGYFYSPEVCV